MNILVIDAQGGGIGRQVISAIKGAYPHETVIAVGANSAATSAMLKAGADQAATGENAVVVCSRSADVIIGPVGIVIADALAGGDHAQNGCGRRAKPCKARPYPSKPLR